MLEFVIGVIFGIISIILLASLFVYFQFSQNNGQLNESIEFHSSKMPEELKKFLNIDNKTSNMAPRVESCFSISMLLHFLFQEHKDTRIFRRWLHKRLQLEINDISSRNAAAHYIIQYVKIKHLDIGDKFPIIKDICVEDIKMCDNDNSIESLTLLVNLTYSGNFYTSIFASTIFGDTSIGVKITTLQGKGRIIMSRSPYPHWAFSFVSAPQLELNFDTKLGGLAEQYCIPLIEKQFRNVIQRKQVWPNYKIRYRPFFPNPLMQPTPNAKAFNHVDIQGGLEINILQGSRLPVQILNGRKAVVYCAVFLDPKPFANFNANCNHCSTIMINFPRHNHKETLGLTFSKHSDDFGGKKIKIENVIVNSSAFDAGFRQGDIILSVNNVVVSNPNHAIKLLNTKGDLSVLVERENDDLFRSDTPDFMQECFDEELVDIEFNVSKIKNDQLDITPILETDLVAKNDDKKESSTKELSKSVTTSESTLKSKNDYIPSEKCDSISLKESISREFILDSPNLRKISTEERPMSMIETSHKNNLIKWKSADNLNLKNLQYNKPTKSIENKVPITPCNTTKKCDSDNLSLGPSEVSEDAESLTDSKNTGKRAKIAAKCALMVNKLAATKSKVNNMIKSRKEKNLGNENDKDEEQEEILECEEATEENMFINDDTITFDSDSVISGSKHQKRPVFLEVPVVDGFKSKIKNATKGKRTKRNVQSDGTSSEKDINFENVKDNGIKVFAKNTTSVELKSKVSWNEKLLFTLEKNCTKYLNILVYAKYIEGSDNENKVEKNKNDKEYNEKTKVSKETSEDIELSPILLGYTSIFVPQIIDDCNLTMSKCHCEVFDLRPTKNSNFHFTTEYDISSKPGFDKRLCFGDIKIFFRHLDSEITDEMLRNSESLKGDNKSIDSDILKDIKKTLSTSDSIGKEKVNSHGKYQHVFTNISGKKNDSFVCVICKTKHWFAGLIKCSVCNILVHSKGCSEKACTEIECVPMYQDSDFEELDTTILLQDSNILKKKEEHDSKDRLSLISLNSDHHTPFDRSSTGGSIRRRKFSEKVSSGIKFLGKAYNRASKVDSKLPNAQINVNLIKLDDIIHDYLIELDCPYSLRQLLFEPNNAYNEHVIKNVKDLGVVSFKDITDTTIRRNKNNEKITDIQKIISRLAFQRKEKLIYNSKNSQNEFVDSNDIDTEKLQKNKEELIEIDLKLQALALVMIHYCEGLSACDEQG
uniref:PDZ domain-containing protein n=1 Tax=Parastrongyloides trichosuri TaxID=131310 RepID=A0A0N4ZIS0_PARTI